MKYGVGDAVVTSSSHGVVVEPTIQGPVCVQLLSQDPQTRVWHVGSAVVHLNLNDIMEHVSIDGDDGNAPRVWDQLGFRMLDGGSFVRKSDESSDSSHLFPVGDPVFDVISDDDEEDEDDNGISEEMRDFIVPDDECEPFTKASEDTAFVREMHSSVEWFKRWEPSNPREYAVRDGIRRLEAHAARLDDNARFSRGMRAVSYN